MQLNRITDLNRTTVENLCCDASVASHGIVAPCPQNPFHSRTGFTRPTVLQDHVADSELLPFQSEQIDSGNNQVPADELWSNLVTMKHSSNGHEMFMLDQGDLALRSFASFELVVADNPTFCNDIRLMDDRDLTKTL